MKAFNVKGLALSTLGLALVAMTSVASAGDWHRRTYVREYYAPVRIHYSSPTFHIGIGIGVDAYQPVYAPVCDPYPYSYCEPTYYGPSVVVGLGGRYHHGWDEGRHYGHAYGRYRHR